MLTPKGGSVPLTRRPIARAESEAPSARERRLAEREAVLNTMEEYGLLIRTRGDQ